MLANLSAEGGLLALDSVVIKMGATTIGPVSVSVSAGERVAILGPSGAGKSSLLKLMSGEWTPSGGKAAFRGQALKAWSPPQLSRHRAVLPQSSDVAFGLLTDLVIGLGRVSREPDPDLAGIVRSCAALAHATHLLGRRFDTLSGGEFARVQLARVFAQLWDVKKGLVLVDEPLAALDPGLQFDLLSSLEAFASERGHAVVAILHDINQALLGFDRLLLIKAGKLVADCACSAQVVPALEDLYGIRLSCFTDAQGCLVVTPLRKSVRHALPEEALA